MPRVKKQSFQDLVEKFSRWQPDQVDAEDLGNLDLLLTVRQDYLDQDPLTWREGDLTQLLLEVFPRKVQSDPSLLSGGPAVLGRFLRFLAQTDRLKGSGIFQQEDELAQVGPRFAAAMSDTSRYGMAKSLFASMSDDGVQLDDERAVQQWVGAYNGALGTVPDDVLDGVLPEPEAPVVLPPVTLADKAELRELAAAAPLVVRVGALLSHIGPSGRTVTQTGALRLVDAVALAEPCGDADRLHRPEHWQRPVRRMTDLTGVTEAYELAVDAGLLDLVGTRVRRDPSEAGVQDVLARAAALADVALHLGVFMGDPPQRLEDVVDGVSAALPALLALLYAAAEPAPLDALAAELAEELGVVRPERSGGTVTVRSYLERAFARFERLGMLARLGLHVPGDRAWLGRDGEQSTSIALTPLGVWWLQQTLPRFGARAPLVGELASATARELCTGLEGYGLEDGQAELAAWAAARGPEEAARQVAQLLADPDVACRQLAVHVLDSLPGAADAVRPLLEQSAARPYARFWLESHSLSVPERWCESGDRLLLFVETAGLMVELGAVGELVAQLPGLGDAGEQVDLVRQLWRVESPFTEPVLLALAGVAPPVVSKAARKALHSLRSAGRARVSGVQ